MCRGVLKRAMLTAVSIFILSSAANSVFAQDTEELTEHTSEPQDNADSYETEKTGSNINIDTEFLYGQYNNMAATFSMIQGLDLFAYQFNADFKRSDNYGYENSSYYDNSVEIACQVKPTDTLLLTPSVDIRNESHGMFDNTTYSREERDRVLLLLKNEYRSTPSGLQLNFGYTQYIHRLTGARTFKSKLDKFSEELGWERVFSASHKISLRSYSCQYLYPDLSAPEGASVKNDFHTANEFTWSIKLFEYLKLSLSPMFFWNRDAAALPGGRVQLDTDSLRFLSLGLSYSYEMLPFQPEDLYFNQNYVKDYNFLPPNKRHAAELQGSFTLEKRSAENVYLKALRIKHGDRFEINDSFYNYAVVPRTEADKLITAESLKVTAFYSSVQCLVELALFSWTLGFNVGYTLNKFFADYNVTYKPEHIFLSTISLGAGRLDIEWENNYRSSMYIDESKSDRLSGALISSLDVQFKVAESVSLNMRVNNLYNIKYRLRDGYPEPGFTILGGLRIVI